MLRKRTEWVSRLSSVNMFCFDISIHTAMVLFGSVILSHPKTINAKVVSSLNRQYILNAVIKKFYNYDMW